MQFLLSIFITAMFQPWLLLYLYLFLFSLLHPLSFSQLNSPQNIEIFFPFLSTPPILSPPNFHTPSQQVPVTSLTRSSHRASDHDALVKAVVATMTSAIVVAGVILFFLHKSSLSRHSHRNEKTDTGRSRPGLQEPDRIGGPIMNLKPLHWDMVRADHSMVSDKTPKNSFGYNDDIMEALFGYVATDRKTPGKKKIPSNISTSPPAQVIILDPHKSQKRTTVIRSLSVTREEILDAFLEGKTTLDIDTLEKLIEIAPNREEEALILEFDGNPTKLADAESFLYHLFQAIPSPFLRLKAMHFRANYEAKIVHLKETLQTLEFGCIELQMHGFLSKLLEALNETTCREELKLDGSQKLFDVKGTHGTTTPLKFLVEELVRSEGRSTSMMINQIHNLNPNNAGVEEEEGENDEYYMMLGLQALGDLNVKFCNATKAASIDYDAFIETWFDLRDRADEIWKLLDVINGDSEEDGFVMEMEGFLDEAEVELEMVRKGETKVLEVVKGIVEAYNQTAGGFGDQNEKNPIQVFAVFKEFISMVDQICVEIDRNLKKKDNDIL